MVASDEMIDPSWIIIITINMTHEIILIGFLCKISFVNHRFEVTRANARDQSSSTYR